MKKGHKYGTHRVISPKGVLPQPADKLDNNMDEIYDNEILIDVQTLNIDSASFTQISNQAGGDKAKIAEIMLDIVEKQGKHRNPVTGSGGMLLGTVEKIGDALVGKTDLKVGDKIATLVSLSLTPLRIDKIKEIRPDVDQVDIDGKAILFESGIYAKIPSDLPEKLVMSALDVAGAPAQVAKLVRPGNTVLIIGAAGKSGMLCCYEARKRVGVTGKVIGLCYSPEEKERLDKLGFCHEVVCMDARQPIPVLEKITELTNGEMCDITFDKVDTSDFEAVTAAAKRVADKFGKIDILINNAGITNDSTLKKMTVEQWQNVIDVNLSGTFYCCKAVLNYMLEAGYGRIVNASSVVGLYGNFGQTNYVATKAGLIGMTKTMARELGRKGITVNAVAPGFIETEMVAKMPENVLDGMRAKVPVGRLGRPEEIAAAYLYLASDEAAYVNGAVLSVDGGMTV